MLHSLLRSLKCRQIGQVQLNIQVSDAGVVSGPDAAFVSSVDHVAASGLYVITLKEAAKLAPVASGLVLHAATASAYVPATTVSTVSVQTALAGVAADAAFTIQLQFSEQLGYYF